jgi:hypothetical protein
VGAHVPVPELTDRYRECGVLDRLVESVRAGEGRALVVRGEPGVGKTVLLDYLASRAPGCRVVRAAGVQSEMELAFAGLHQLCAPMLHQAESLPVPQRVALRTALGLSAGPVPDRFLVGLAVLGLLCEAAGERPLICVVDDEQWLDHASAQALEFAARRLAADPVGLVFAARVPGEHLAGLPELVVEGLTAPPVATHLPNFSAMMTVPMPAQMKISPKTYCQASDSATKNVPKVAMAVIASVPASQMGLSTQYMTETTAAAARPKASLTQTYGPPSSGKALPSSAVSRP